MQRTRTASNLKEYGYDMVVGTTQKALNATLKNYLYHMEDIPYEKYYDDDHQEMSSEQMSKITGGKDIFSIVKEANENNEEAQAIVQAAFDAGLTQAFRATMGIPKGMQPKDIPTLIELIDPGEGIAANVRYNAFFKTFEILELSYDRKKKGAKTHCCLQDDKAPWIFKFTVCLDFTSDSFNNLPEAIQKQLKSMNAQTGEIDPDEMFSIQQLYLDLNSTALESEPQIEGIDDPVTKTLIEAVFRTLYFEELKKQNGTILGYTVSKKDVYENRGALIKPTDFTFRVSPYLREDGQVDKGQREYYTLDYLVMSEHKPFPNPENYPKACQPFTWNWVTNDGKAQSQVHGAMAINREDILKLLKEKFDLTLEPLILKVNADVDASWTKIKYVYGIHPDNEHLSQAHYELAGQDEEAFWNALNFRVFDRNKNLIADKNQFKSTDLVLKFEYEASDKGEDNHYVPPCAWVWGNLEIKYKVKGGMVIKDDKIYCNLNLKTHVHMNFEGGVSEGVIDDRILSTTIIVRVDQNGQIYFQGEPIVEVQNDTDFDMSIWSEIISIGTINKCTNQVKQTCQKAVNDAINKYNYNMNNALIDSKNWVFPAGKTFTFSDVCFSDEKDLTVNLTYTDPNLD